VLDDGVELMLVRDGVNMLSVLEGEHMLACIDLIRISGIMIRENILKVGYKSVRKLFVCG